LRLADLIHPRIVEPGLFQAGDGVLYAGDGLDLRLTGDRVAIQCLGQRLFELLVTGLWRCT